MSGKMDGKVDQAVMVSSGVPVDLAEENRARADLYALFARLFHAGPDERLLRAFVIAEAVPGEGGFLRTWAALAEAARKVDADAATREYDAVFVEAGEAGVSLHASRYLGQAARERVLERLRSDLAGLGIARGVAGPEDHIVALFEVMRHLILKAGAALGNDDAVLKGQAEFFDRYLAHSYPGFIGAIENCSRASFYRAVSRCAKAFLDVECEALGMSA